MCLLSADDPRAAADLLAPVADIVLVLDIGEPVVSPFFADAVDALVAVGRPEDAAALVTMLESWGHRSGSRWPTGVGARGRALLLLEDGDLDGCRSALQRAESALDDPTHRYERARTLLVLAAWHRRRRRRTDALEALTRARDLFAEVGASGWVAHAERRVERLGLQRSDGQELTPSERQVAALAAAGLTNVAVATQLSVSPKTVEAHLTRIYQKLAIHSRAELGRWQATQARPPR
jgi:DNA-binding CsgD family transcriptional regulator